MRNELFILLKDLPLIKYIVCGRQCHEVIVKNALIIRFLLW
jgi:hypothetical protein